MLFLSCMGYLFISFSSLFADTSSQFRKIYAFSGAMLALRSLCFGVMNCVGDESLAYAFWLAGLLAILLFDSSWFMFVAEITQIKNHFTPQYGTLTVKPQDELPDNMLSVYIAVSDMSIGMNEEQQSRVFNPFEQAEKHTSMNYGGTGLGLSITKHIAEMMGSQVGLTSVPGQGSTFFCSILVTRGTAIEVEEDYIDALPSFSACRLLLVGDIEINSIATELLKPLAVELDHAEHGQNWICSAQTVCATMPSSWTSRCRLWTAWRPPEESGTAPSASP